MLIYLDHAVEVIRARCAAEGLQHARVDFYRAIMIGTVERVRPKIMTVTATSWAVCCPSCGVRERFGGHAKNCRADDWRNDFVERF